VSVLYQGGEILNINRLTGDSWPELFLALTSKR
jgi:hypothetical protein